MTPLSIPDSDVSPTDVSVGLSAAEAARRLAEHGPNKLADPPTRPRWRRFVDQFRSLLVGVLAGAAVLAAVLGDLKDAVIVGVVLLINAVLGYVQEGKAEQAMTALKQMLVAHSRVRRDGQLVEVPSDDLVPGDIVLLEAGDRVPADGRFVLAAALRVDEAPLTGESVPIDKIADPNADPDDDAEASGTLTDRPDSGFMNTTVVRGRGELLVERTGMATEMGKVAALLHEAEPGPTPLQIQLDKLGKKLAAVAAVAVGVVLATRLIQGEDLAEAVLGAVALAVAAIPEGLPAVVTVTLAVGVHQMALRQAIVKRLASVETLGSTTVICSDKTGTLTRNEMRAREAVHGDGVVRLDDDGHTTAELGSDVRRAIESAALCNDAALDEDGALVGDPTEGALLGLAVAVGVDPDACAGPGHAWARCRSTRRRSTWPRSIATATTSCASSRRARRGRRADGRGHRSRIGGRPSRTGSPPRACGCSPSRTAGWTPPRRSPPTAPSPTLTAGCATSSSTCWSASSTRRARGATPSRCAARPASP
ncbi:MAG: HAD-IC family P-type ATPase [Acidimicrobiales bacterium]